MKENNHAEILLMNEFLIRFSTFFWSYLTKMSNKNSGGIGNKICVVDVERVFNSQKKVKKEKNLLKNF